MDAKGLAALALRVLDTQKVYFKTKSGDVLRECKNLEQRLRDEANAVLNPESAGLFSEETE